MRASTPMLLACCLALLLGCEAQEESGGGIGNEYTYCNEKAGGDLSVYARCRCRQLTGTASEKKEMDVCINRPKMYARGFDGEIPQNIREAMTR